MGWDKLVVICTTCIGRGDKRRDVRDDDDNDDDYGVREHCNHIFAPSFPNEDNGHPNQEQPKWTSAWPIW